MEFSRLDNRRLPTDFVEYEAPVVTVTKSYAKLSPAAAAILGVGEGDFVGFHVSSTGEYAFSKAVDSKGGKKLSGNLTLVSESIYKRLKEGTTYVVGTAVHAAGVDYFPLQEGTTEVPEEVDQTTPAPEPVVAEDDFI